MTPEEERAHLTAPSSDPKQRMIDYWGRKAEKYEDALQLIANQKGDHWSKGVARRALEGK